MQYIDEHVKAYLARCPRGRTINQLARDLQLPLHTLRASLQRLETTGGAHMTDATLAGCKYWRAGK